MWLGPALALSLLPKFREPGTPASSSIYCSESCIGRVPLESRSRPYDKESEHSSLRDRKLSRWPQAYTSYVQLRASLPVCFHLVTSFAKLTSHSPCCQEEKQGACLEEPEQGSQLH